MRNNTRNHIHIKLQWINLGGGYVWDETTDFGPLQEAVDLLTTKYGLQVFLEPGAGIVNSAGYLVASVIDLFKCDGKMIAVLDTTVNHLPEVFEYQYEPDVIEHVDDAPHEYILAGCSCMSGDLFGEGAVAALIKEREESGPYKAVQDFVSRQAPGALNVRTMEYLIKSGAFDRFGHNRPSLLRALPELMEHAGANYRAPDEAQASLFELMSSDELSQLSQAVPIPHVQDWPEHERLDLVAQPGVARPGQRGRHDEDVGEEQAVEQSRSAMRHGVPRLGQSSSGRDYASRSLAVEFRMTSTGPGPRTETSILPPQRERPFSARTPTESNARCR